MKRTLFPGSALLLITISMTFIMIGVIVLWRSIALMHDCSLARQNYFYQRLALENIMYCGIKMIQNHENDIQKNVIGTYHLQDSICDLLDDYKESLIIGLTDTNYTVSAFISNDTRSMQGWCTMTMSSTHEARNKPYWYIDAWTIQ